MRVEPGKEEEGGNSEEDGLGGGKEGEEGEGREEEGGEDNWPEVANNIGSNDRYFFWQHKLTKTAATRSPSPLCTYLNIDKYCEQS